MHNVELQRSLGSIVKILRVWIYPTKKTGGSMTFHRNRLTPGEYAQGMQDVLLVSSFAAWALLLGFAPVMTYRMLVG